MISVRLRQLKVLKNVFCFVKPYIRALYTINLSFKIIERPIFLLVFNTNIHQE